MSGPGFEDVSTVLATLRSEADVELAPLFYTMEDLWERKLWHQLTQVLVEFYSDDRSAPLRLRLFTQFISTFQDKINQLSLVLFGISAAGKCQDNQDAYNFISGLSQKVDSPSTQDAFVLSQVELARIKLKMQDLNGARDLLESSSKVLDDLDSAEPVIKAAYYEVSAEYFQLKADFNSYYKNALLYLACINLDDLPLVKQQRRAFELAISALLGDKIYNFGELLLHPILSSLKDTEYSWLCDFIFALNGGDIKTFDSLTSHLSKQPLLQESYEFLRQKICLTALIEAVFQRPSASRILTFDAIAAECHIIVAEVEHLVMKALSIGLIKGSIDQVAHTVDVTWLQPRVMNKSQVESMRARLVKWDEDVRGLSDWIGTAGKEIWTTT